MIATFDDIDIFHLANMLSIKQLRYEIAITE